jgi:hypothetical protein
MPFFLLVGRWLLLALGAKAAASSKVTVTTATTSNARTIFRTERILLLAVRGLSMVVDDQDSVRKKLIINSDEEHPSSAPLFETEKRREIRLRFCLHPCLIDD